MLLRPRPALPYIILKLTSFCTLTPGLPRISAPAPADPAISDFHVATHLDCSFMFQRYYRPVHPRPAADGTHYDHLNPMQLHHARRDYGV